VHRHNACAGASERAHAWHGRERARVFHVVARVSTHPAADRAAGRLRSSRPGSSGLARARARAMVCAIAAALSPQRIRRFRHCIHTRPAPRRLLGSTPTVPGAPVLALPPGGCSRPRCGGVAPLPLPLPPCAMRNSTAEARVGPRDCRRSRSNGQAHAEHLCLHYYIHVYCFFFFFFRFVFFFLPTARWHARVVLALSQLTLLRSWSAPTSAGFFFFWSIHTVLAYLQPLQTAAANRECRNIFMRRARKSVFGPCRHMWHRIKTFNKTK